MVDLATKYPGYLSVPDMDPRIADMFSDPTKNVFDLLENQYLIIQSEDGKSPAIYVWQNGRHRLLKTRQVSSDMIGKVKAKNPEQACAIDMLMDPKTTVKCMTGSFGSGKTFLACACAFELLQSNKTEFDKIMWVRNNIEVKDSHPIGYLKGSFYDKMVVWAMPLADHMGGKDMLEMSIQQGKVDIEHLGFLRGRDIKNTIVICTEAEHLTREHVQLLLGRIAEGSILILEGDVRQIDAKAFEQDNGLQAAIERLRGNPLFAYVHLHESVRSETARLADLLNN